MDKKTFGTGLAVISILFFIFHLSAAPAWSGPNLGAGCAIDLDLATTDYDSGVSEKDIEAFKTVEANEEFWIAVVAQNVENLDTFQVEVNFDSAKLSFVKAAEDNPLQGIDNLLKKNGGTTIGFQAILIADGVVNIADSLIGSSTDEAPEGSGVIALLQFRALPGISDTQLTPDNVFFLDSVTTSDSPGTLSSAAIEVETTEKPVVNSFSATPASILEGETSTLTWDVSGAENVTIDNCDGPFDAASGTKQVSPQTTTTYTLTATNQAGATTASVSLTVSSPIEKPTVNSFVASSSTIVAGGSATLSWDVSGAETVTIDNCDGPFDAESGTKQVSPQATTTYTLTATNQAGATTASVSLTVSSPIEKPTVNSFAASSSAIVAGGSATLSWDVSGAETVTIDNCEGPFDAASGTKQVSPQATTTYTLTATNQAGATTASVTLTVSSPIEKPAVNSFAASPSAIVAGGSATLSWDVSGAETVTIDNCDGPFDAESGTRQVSPQATTTYTLTATNQAGATTARVTLTLLSPIEIPTVNSFEASSSAIVAGGSATLSWDVSDAETVTIDNGVGQVDAASGTKQVSPQATTTYTLTATNQAGETTASLTLIVFEKPTVKSFAASPPAIAEGGSATLSWDVSDAETVTIDNGVGQVDTESGAVQVSPDATTTYTLTAENQAGETTSSITVTVSAEEIVEEIVDGPGDGVVLIIKAGEFQGTPTSVQAHEQAPADFPLGLFDFTLQSLSPGATVQVEVYTPKPVSENALFYHHTDGQYLKFDSADGLDDGDNTFIIIITDGGAEDGDGVADGRIEFKGGPAYAVFKLYYPHVASDDLWETEIAVVNANAEVAIDGELRAYDENGERLYTLAPVVLGPFARRQFTIGETFDSAESIRYLAFCSDIEGAKGYTKFFVQDTYRVAVPAVSEISTGDIHISHIASDNHWFTGFALVNTTISALEALVEFDNGVSKTLEIPAGGHVSFTMRKLFDGQAQPEIHTARIADAPGLIGLELFGAGNQLSGILLNDKTADTIYYPHVAFSDYWNTGVVAHNPSDTLCQATITSYNSQGEELGATEVEIGPRESFVGNKARMGLPEDAAWIKVEGSSPITGFELFAPVHQNSLAGYTGVDIRRNAGVLPKIDQEGHTGLAVVNPNTVEANVSLTAYDDDGVAVARVDTVVGPNEKILGTVENIFEGDDISGATYVAFESDQSVVAFQINGSSDLMMLDAIEGM